MCSRYQTVVLTLGLLVFIANSQQEQNQLAPVIKDLSVVARLINGISVQSDFMRSSKNLNAVVGELLGVGDSIPELLKLNVKDLMKDVDELLKAVKGSTTTSNQSLEAIGDAMKYLKSIDLAKLKKADSVNWISLNSNWGQASVSQHLYPEKLLPVVKSLKYIMETQVSDGQKSKIRDHLKNFVKTADGIGTAFEELENAATTMKGLWQVIGTKSELQDFAYNCEVFEKFLTMRDVFMSLGQAFSDLKTSLTELDPVIKKLQTSSTDSKSLEIIDKTFSKDKITDKNLTAGFPDGISDMKLIFDDLNGKWLKENLAGGKDVKMLVTALEPLKKFYENLKPLETSWSTLKTDRATGKTIGNIASVLFNGKTMKPDELTFKADPSAACVNGSTVVSNTVPFDDFKNFYNKLDTFEENVKLLQKAIDGTVGSPVLTKIKQFRWDSLVNSINLDFNDVSAEAKKISENPSILEMSTVIFEYSDALEKSNTKEMSEMIKNWTQVKSIHKKLSRDQLFSTIDCLTKMSIDFTATEAFARFERGIRALKNQADAQQSMKTFGDAIQSLISADKNLKETVNGMKVSRRRRRRSLGPEAKGLLKLADSQKVARNLGNGMEVLRELNEVFVNQEKVLKIASVEASVDAVIQSVPEITRKWTVENKKALKTLVDDVNKLNKDVGKNRSLESRWMLFAHAQSVNGAPIEGRILGNAVFKVLDKHSDTSVKKAAVDFKDFPPLQFDFTGEKKADSRDAFTSLQTIVGFFEDFFNRELTSSSKPSEASSNFILYVIAVVFLIAVLISGAFFGLRFYRNRNMSMDRSLIYIAFQHADEEQINEVLRAQQHARGREIVKKGVYLSMHDSYGETPLHYAIPNAETVEMLIVNGADRAAVNFQNETAEQVVDRRLAEYEKEDKNIRMISDLKKVKQVFKKHKTRNYRQKIPPLLPINDFVVLLPIDGHAGFQKAYPGKWTTSIDENRILTHSAVPVDKNGVFHFDKECYVKHFQVILGTTVVVPLDWVDSCVKDSKNFYKDYERRVRKVEFNGKTYATLDKLKEFARGRHIQYGCGLTVYLLLVKFDYEDFQNLLEKLAFSVSDDLSKQPDLLKKSFYRPDMKNFIVYDGASIEQHAKKLKGVNVDDYTVMSIDEFTAFLLELGITGADGGAKVMKAKKKAQTEREVAMKKRGSNK